MRLSQGKRSLALLLFLPALILGCSEGDEVVTGPSGPDPVDPLTSDYWALEEGDSWSYMRKLRTSAEVFGNILYQGYDLEMSQILDFATETPFEFLNSPHVTLEVTGTENGDWVLRGTRSEDFMAEGDIVNQLEIYLDAQSDGLVFHGENTDTAIDSTLRFDEFEYDYDMIRFGVGSWGMELQDFSVEPAGMIAIGDLDADGRSDSLIAYDLGFSVVAEQDLDYASELSSDDLEFLEEGGYEALLDTVITGCRWVRQSLYLDLLLTNQRDPDAGPGQSGIPDEYLPERKREVTARMDLRLWLLAPDLGPVRIVTCRDLDGLLMAADMDATELTFQPDLMEIDYLIDSSRLH